MLLISSKVPGIRQITAVHLSFGLVQHSGYPLTTLIILRRIGGSIPKVEQRSQNRTSPYPVTSVLGNRLLHLQRDATNSNDGVISEPPQSLHLCVFVCSFRYPACSARASYCHLWPDRLYNIFSTLAHKRHDFRKKKSLNIKRVLCSLLSSSILYSRLQRVTIPDAVII